MQKTVKDGPAATKENKTQSVFTYEKMQLDVAACRRDTITTYVMQCVPGSVLRYS